MSQHMALFAVGVTVLVGGVNLVLVIGMTRQAAQTRRALIALARFTTSRIAGTIPREVEDILGLYGGGNHRGR
jgi:hypothetical protein